MLNVFLFAGSYIGGFLLSFLLNPAISFALYEAVYFFNPPRRWWGSMVPDISYSFFVVVLMGTLLVLNYSKLKNNKILVIPQIRWLLAIFTLYGIASFYAVFPEQHFDSWIIFLKAIVIMLIAFKLCDTDAKFDIYLYGYIFGAWYISYMTYQVGRNSGGRVAGIGTVDAPNANTMAAAMAPALVFCLYYFWMHDKKLFKVLFALAGIFIANALVLINSRGAFLATVISLTYFMGYMYFSKVRLNRQRLLVIVIAVLGLSGALYLADDSFIERMYTIQDTEVQEERETGATRTIFWKAAWEMAKDYPFGKGWRGFNAFSPAYIPEGVNTGGNRSRTVHSTWFEALTEIGYLGLVCLLLMIYSIFKTLKKCKQVLKANQDLKTYYKIIAIEAAVICFMVSMTFLNRLRAEIFMWLILYSAIAYSLYFLHRQVDISNEHAKEP